ncbi:hypothetical protein AAVH_00637 [Aphelenchoides avenae]|nr:hypothetical protein AAVH_00637 [Aphelenchus avenae]
MSDDPCQCLFNHEAMMRRLISLLRDSQNDCTDGECNSDSLGSAGGDNGNMMFLAMLWGVLAMALFFMRPSSMRRGNDDQLQEKPRPGDNGPGNDPPAPDVQ